MYDSSPRHDFAFLYSYIYYGLCGAQVGNIGRHTCISHFAKSKDRILGETSHTTMIKMCKCVDMEVAMMIKNSLITSLLKLFMSMAIFFSSFSSYPFFFSFSFFSKPCSFLLRYLERGTKYGVILF